MVKKLPQVKKGLKEFILDEDAKVMDKTATKIAVTATFIGFNFLLSAEDANAKGHSDHSDHQNTLNAPENYGTGIHAGTNPMSVGVNQISEKSVETMHANHYNHQDQSGGGQGGFGMIIGAVVGIAISVAFGPAGWFASAGLYSSITAVNVALGVAITGAGAMAGSALDSSGSEGAQDIVLGSPHQVPESILRALEDEEE